MCAILDANTVSEVFGPNRAPAKAFFDWLSTPHGQLIVGGKVLDELQRNERFLDWLRIDRQRTRTPVH